MFKALYTLIISGHILRQCLCDFLQGLEKCPMEDKISREHKHSSTKCLPTRTPRLLSVVLKETSGQRLMGNMTSKRLPRRKDTDSGIMFTLFWISTWASLPIVLPFLNLSSQEPHNAYQS